jgi:hypothetical protein
MTPENYGKCEDDTKTQTRRIIKLPKESSLGVWEPTTLCGPDGGKTKDGMTLPEQAAIWHTRSGKSLLCPYGTVGDRLYVKEAHAIMSIDGETVAMAYKNRLPKGKTLADTDGGLNLFLLSEEELKWAHEKQDCERWRSPLFMPKWAARLWLEIVEVRVERLNDISEVDARAEGVISDESYPTYKDAFRWSWCNIQKSEDAWIENPWVWVLLFRTVRP